MIRATALCLILIFLVNNISIVRGDNVALETNDVSDHFLSTSINFIFDIFLKHYTGKIAEEGKTQIKVDDFERRFATKILSLDIEGAIVVSDGWCGNVSTLHRTGDADMKRIGEDIVLTAHLGLSELKVDYDNYDVSILGAHQQGKINVRIGANSLRLELKVQVKPSCLIYLTQVNIEQLDDIKVDITNLGVFENLTDEISSWVINEVTKWYKGYIENILYPELSKAVKDADLCHYLPI